MQSDSKRIAKWIFGQPVVYAMVPLILSIVFSVVTIQWFRLAIFLIIGGMIWLHGHWFFTGFFKDKWSVTTWASTPTYIENGNAIFVKWQIVVSTLIFLLGFVGIESVISTEMEMERDDAFQHLSIDNKFPPGKESRPEETVTTITNGSSQQISPHHQLTCFVRMEVDFEGKNRLKNATLAHQSDGTWIISSEGPKIYDLDFSAPLAAGGDAQTDTCLKAAYPSQGIKCVDVTINFLYFLSDQPKRQQIKSERMIAELSGNEFVWEKQPLALNKSPCEKYLLSTQQ